MSFYDRITNIDRRIIFLMIALGVIIPLLFQVSFTEYPTPMTEKVFNKIENLPEGSKILISYDYDPASEPELHPMAVSFIRHCALKHHKLYLMALWPMGQAMAQRTIEVLKKEFPDYEYGKDYIHLGYKVGGQMVINVVLSNFYSLYTQDVELRKDLKSFPIMQGVNNIKNMDLLVPISAGDPGTQYWVQYAGDPGKIPIASGVTAVQAPLFYPYYPKQLVGLLGGIKGGAEYEAALMLKYEQYNDKKLHTAVRSMGPQTIAHAVIIFFILIGNITYFVAKRKNRG